jgi:hypothetical protein
MDLLTAVATKERELDAAFRRPGFPASADDVARARRLNDEFEALVDALDAPSAKSRVLLHALFGGGGNDEESVPVDYHRLRVEPVRLSPIRGGM